MLVERERADVAVLVALLFLQTLLEVTVLLETVLLSHLALLLVGLHRTALGTEDFHLTVEHLVLTELALQRTVVQGYLDAGLQANLLEALLAIAEYPGVVACKLVLQALANHTVGAQQVGCRDALAVGRVHHDDALLRGLCEVLEVLLLYGDAACQTSCLHIATGCVDGLHVDVVAIEVALHVVFLVLLAVVVDTVEEVSVEVGPFLEGILLTEQARGHVVGNEGSLDEQCATATHRVNEVGVALPACHHDHAGCQHLVQGGFKRLLAIAATMQRLATGVEAQCALVLSDVYVQTDVGVGYGDVRTLACSLAELVHDGVLDLV